MRIATGRVVNGHVEVDWSELPEGSVVGVIVPDDTDGFKLTPEEEAELSIALEEADKDDAIDAAEVIRLLRERVSQF